MQISVTELVAVLVIYTAMTGSGLYWLWHRAHADQRARAKWAAALFVMPVPALIVMGVVRPGWPPGRDAASGGARSAQRQQDADGRSQRVARRARPARRAPGRSRAPSPAQAAALAGRLRREERLEHLRPAGAAGCPCPCPTLPPPRRSREPPAASLIATSPADRRPRRDVQRPSVRHGVARVQAQVQDRLFDLGRIDVDGQRVRRAGHRELDARTGQRLGQFGDGPHDLAQVDLAAAIRRRDGRGSSADRAKSDARRSASEAACAWSLTSAASSGVSAIRSRLATATSSALLKSWTMPVASRPASASCWA